MKELKNKINDLWPDVDSLPDSQEYIDFVKEKERKSIEKATINLNAQYKKSIDKLTNEYNGKKWLLDHNISIENCIYYDHTKNFCFGWRNPLNETEKKELVEKLADFPFNYYFK